MIVIEAMISRLDGLAVTLHDADPDDKSEVYQQLGLRLIYQPGRQVVRGAIRLEAPGHWFFDGVRGATRNLRTWCRSHWPRSSRSVSHDKRVTCLADALWPYETEQRAKVDVGYIHEQARRSVRQGVLART